MPAPSAPEPLVRLLEPVVREAGLDLEQVRVTPAGRRRLLRVVVDADGGVSLDAVAGVSERISAALDSSDAMGQVAYVLEVTSPGVDRLLTETRHWRRAIGRLVRVQRRGGAEVVGRIETVDEGEVILDVAGTMQAIPRADVARARVEVEFTRPQTEPDADDAGSAASDLEEP